MKVVTELTAGLCIYITKLGSFCRWVGDV